MHAAKSAAVGTWPSTVRVTANEMRRIRASTLTTLYRVDPWPLSFTIR